MDWLAPTFGLVGVLIGGVLTAYLASRAERVKARSTALAYAVLLRDKLTIASSRIESALSRGRWGAVLDPGLPYAAGLWAVEHREGVREGSIWPESRAIARSPPQAGGVGDPCSAVPADRHHLGPLLERRPEPPP